MIDKGLKDMTDVYGLYTQIDLDNHIAHINELLNRSNLRLAEEQIKNSELQKQCDAQKARIEELEKQLDFANKTCDNCDNYYCAEWAEGTKCHAYGCRNKSKWEPRRNYMLIFTLKKEWYEKIKNGEKTVEYREVKDYWTKRIKNVVQELNLCGKPICYFQLGYNPDTRLKATISRIERVDGKNTDLKIDKPVYAIHFKLED